MKKLKDLYLELKWNWNRERLRSKVKDLWCKIDLKVAAFMEDGNIIIGRSLLSHKRVILGRKPLRKVYYLILKHVTLQEGSLLLYLNLILKRSLLIRLEIVGLLQRLKLMGWEVKRSLVKMKKKRDSLIMRGCGLILHALDFTLGTRVRLVRNLSRLILDLKVSLSRRVKLLLGMN